MTSPVITAGSAAAAPPAPPSAPVAGSSYLPAADAGSDPLALIYASSLVQQTTASNSDGAREQAATNLRDKQLKAQKKELDERDHGGRGLFGAVTHFLEDAVKDLATDNYVGLVKDVTHDISHDMINNPAFWSDLKQAAEVVGMVAGAVGSMVVTGGTSAPVLIAVGLSIAAMVDSKAHILQKLGVSAGAAGWIDVGAGAAAAVVTIGASLTTTAATASQTATELNAGAQAINGGSQLAGGVAAVGSSVLAKHDADLEADATRRSNDAKALESTVQWILDGMKEAQKSNQRVLSTVKEAMQTRQATSTALSNFGKA